MANAMISQPWTPPESKGMQAVLKYGIWAAIGLGGVYAFTVVAPTMVDALTLLDTILQDATHMAISGAIMLGTLWFLRETFSSSGSINKLLRLPYWLVVNGLTRFFITIDPLSPITERLKAVLADKETFERQFETLDGLISNLAEKEQKYRELSLRAQRMGMQANKQGAKAAVEVASHSFGSYKEASESYAKTRMRLEPIRATFQNISQACDVTAQKLTLDRDLLADKWNTQKAVHAATDAAGRILGRSRTQVWNDAEQAEAIIDNKYGEELGHLDHLKRYAEPFLQSIDVENASYSEEMLAQVQDSSAKLIQSTAATALPAPSPASPVTGGVNPLASLIH